MRGLKYGLTACVFGLVLAGAGQAAAQSSPTPPRQPDPARVVQRTLAKDYKAPEGVNFRHVTIMSEGVRLHGEVFTPKNAKAGEKLPAVVMAHGWGGVAAFLRNDAADIARAGYFVLVFDYRGWGESGSPVMLVDPEPVYTPGEAAAFTAKVQPRREYVNPLEQAEDWFNAIDWIMGEPEVDANRVGIRGSSYSGGHVVHVAAFDQRIKAVVSQVSGMDSRPRPGFEGPGREAGAKMARGEVGYPAPRFQAVAGLIGSPIGHKGERYAPVVDAALVNAPTLILLAESEEYGGNGVAEEAFKSLKGPKELIIIPGITHYAVYSTHRDYVIQKAVEWFDKYLKN